MVGRSSYLDNRGSVDNWGSVDNRGMISRSSMDNGGSVDNRGMISWSRGMISRGSMDKRGMVNRGRGITLLYWESSWGNVSSGGLLIATIAMYRLRSSMRLAHNRSMYSSMGLVDRVA